MRTYKVRFSPEFEEQLAVIFDFIAENSAARDIALRSTDAIVTYCEGPVVGPHPGTKHDDIRAGLRVTNYKGNAVIAFAVDDALGLVSVLGVLYAGQDWQSHLTN